MTDRTTIELFGQNALRVYDEVHGVASPQRVEHIYKAYTESYITTNAAVMLINASDVDELMGDRIDYAALSIDEIIETPKAGIFSKHGVAKGVFVETIAQAEECIKKGQPYILLLPDIVGSYLHVIKKAAGFFLVGSVASHAAIIAGQFKKPMIAIDPRSHGITAMEKITIDGKDKLIVRGDAPTTPAQSNERLLAIISDLVKTISVENVDSVEIAINAEDPDVICEAISEGAEAVGIVRTEHLLLEQKRLALFRSMVMTDDEDKRQHFTNSLMDYHQIDIEKILRAADGRPVTFRLFDPPLHEFMPTELREKTALAEDLGLNSDDMEKKLKELMAQALMMRGVRMAVSRPDIYIMQWLAILKAVNRLKEDSIESNVSILLPMVDKAETLSACLALCQKPAESSIDGGPPDYKVGVMIETPSIAMTTDQIDYNAISFLSFGTNDLTQATLCMDRNDVHLSQLLQACAIGSNPFSTLDLSVARLIKIAMDGAREKKPDISACICGVQAMNALSVTIDKNIKSFFDLGVTGISIAPPAVRKARLLAAQARIKESLEITRQQAIVRAGADQIRSS